MRLLRRGTEVVFISMLAVTASCVISSDSESMADNHAGHTDMDHSEHKNMKHSNDDTMSHDNMDHSSNAGEHAEHRAMIEKKYKTQKYLKNAKSYKLEGLSLVRMDEQAVNLLAELPQEDPIVLNFIFTSCTTVCPVLTATFSQFQDSLGGEASKVKMISISIDPEYDTPNKLRDYAKKFSAGPQWQFYTGTKAQSEQVQRAFDAFRGSKMNHIPLTFLRAPGSGEWVRLEGFTSSIQLLEEYRRLTSS